MIKMTEKEFMNYLRTLCYAYPGDDDKIICRHGSENKLVSATADCPACPCQPHCQQYAINDDLACCYEGRAEEKAENYDIEIIPEDVICVLKNGDNFWELKAYREQEDAEQAMREYLVEHFGADAHDDEGNTIEECVENGIFYLFGGGTIEIEYLQIH